MSDTIRTVVPERRLKLDRLAAFSDGVIAIAITILVLGIEVPSVHDVSRSQLVDYLHSSWHSIVGYVVSFVVIGVYWLEHYVIFHYLTHATLTLVALNGVFLLCLTFLPFPTGLKAAYREDELAMVLYGSAQLICGLSLLVIWLYATTNYRLVDAKIPPKVVQGMTRRVLIIPVFSSLAIGCSFISISLSHLIFLAVPVVYFWLSANDSGWKVTPADGTQEESSD